ncbi:MAG: 30S ribosomal protein S1 [Chloroflexi bacterium]|nr:30S ribosomal protein S1 [Chloroflexota bacterium]
MSSSNSPDELDFATLLEQSFEETIDDLERGDVLTGTIQAIDDYGIIVDVGMKTDGVIPRSEVENLPERYRLGQEVTVVVVKPEDYDGSLVVSLAQARALKDWDAAENLLEEDAVFKGRVIAANRGGLIVPFGELRGFIPASHVSGMPRGLDDGARIDYLGRYVGREINLKVLEVNAKRRRLVFSQRAAEYERKEKIKARLMNEINEGDIIEGTVSSLRDFGAFVDIGGAEGLIHISELSWRRIRHPSEVLQPGQTIDAYVLQLDEERNRIGLSLKRIQPSPWDDIEDTFQVGQPVEGTVTRVVSFGVFVELENGIEALLHISQVGEFEAENLDAHFIPGQELDAVIISLEPDRQRIGLGLPDEQSEPVLAESE